MRLPALALTLVLIAASPLHAQVSCPDRADEPATEGWEALRRSDVDEARSDFEEAISLCPGHPGARTGLGYVDLRSGDARSAGALFRSVLEDDPAEVDAHVGLGLVAWRRGDLDQVEEQFQRVLDLLPGEATARRYLARARRAREQPPPDQAERAFRRGERERSARLYSARVAADPTDVPALHRLALLRAWAGRYDQALELMDRVLQLDSTDVRARVDQARILAWSGRPGMAVDRLDAFLQDRPTDADALEALADILVGRKEEVAASAALLSPPGMGTSAAPEPAFRPPVPVEPARFARAVRSFDSLVEVSHGELEPRIGLGAALTYAGRPDSARSVFRGVLERSPGSLRAQEGLARALTWSGRLRRGEEAWRGVVGTDPGDPDGWVGLGRNLRWQERPAAASRTLEQGRRAAPGSPRIEGQLRRARAALAPRIRVEHEERADGAHLSLSGTRVSALWNLTPRGALQLDLHRSGADRAGEGLSRTLQHALVGVTWSVEPGWTLAGGMGGSRSDGTRRTSQLLARAALESPPGAPLSATVSYDRRPLDGTALELERGVLRERWGVLGRWRPDARWSVTGEGAWSRYRGSESNRRWDAALGLHRKLGTEWRVGLGATAFGFRKDATDGYFDPARYELAEAVAAWTRSWGRWSVEAEAAPGAQVVRRSADPTLALRAEARLVYDGGAGRSVFASAGWARNGLVSAATGIPDYGYRTFRIGGRWALY